MEEEGSYYEGDMILPVGKIGKVTINNLAQRWTNGIVPYVIEGGFSKQIAVGVPTLQHLETLFFQAQARGMP